ncbi:hypothetical protein ACFSS8_23095 [Paracoccus kondratievae]
MRLRGSHFALVTIASFVVLFIYSLTQIVNIDRAFRSEITEGNMWVATQADREAQNMLVTLYRYGLKADYDEVMLRFDILYSRIALMTDRPQFEYFRSIGAGPQVTEVKAMLDDIDAVISANDFDLAEIGTLIPRFSALSSILRDITNALVLKERIERQARRESLQRMFQLLSFAALGTFVSGVVMAGLLWRNMRRSIRAQQELQAHRAELEKPSSPAPSSCKRRWRSSAAPRTSIAALSSPSRTSSAPRCRSFT